MKSLTNRKIGLVAQYFLWSMMASKCFAMSPMRMTVFMSGLMILVTLSGMQLRDILSGISRQSEKRGLILAITISVVSGLIFF